MNINDTGRIVRGVAARILLRISPSYRAQTRMYDELRALRVEFDERERRQRDAFDALSQHMDIHSEHIQQALESVASVRADIIGSRSLLEANFDIERVPKAKGTLGDIQGVMLGMLKEVDRICRAHKLHYWLDFGTLLGAVRHKGFIPWDDDMDLGMMAQDFEEFVRIVDGELESTDYRFIRVPSQIGKIVHKDFMPTTKKEIAQFIHWGLEGKLTFALDIFPYYNASDAAPLPRIRRRLTVGAAHKMKALKGRAEYVDFAQADKIVSACNRELSSTDISTQVFLGLEAIVYQPRLVRYSDIFPTKQIGFEGLRVAAPAHTTAYLTELYGNFMTYPHEPHTHLRLESIPRDDLRRLKEIGDK